MSVTYVHRIYIAHTFPMEDDSKVYEKFKGEHSDITGPPSKEWFAYNELWEKKGYVCRFFHHYTEQDQREGPLMLGCPIRLPHVNPERAIHNARVTLARFSQEIGVYFRTPFVLIEEFGVY